ncbi:MAG: sugar 3,4-ketoisomerase [Alphaproteobacteria bacterium]
MGNILYKVLDLPKVTDGRGNLTFIEGGAHIPFDIRRAYYLYNVPEGQARGGHALKTTQQLLIAISGRFEVHLDDGHGGRTAVSLDRPDQGLHIRPILWRTLENFSPGAVCLSLVSTSYHAEDYCRDYDEFLRIVGAPG